MLRVLLLVLSLQLAAAFNVACAPRSAPAQRWRPALMSEDSAEADLDSIRAARVDAPAAEPAAEPKADEEAPASPLPEGYLERSFSSASIGAGEGSAPSQSPLETAKQTAPFIGVMALIGGLSSLGLLDF